MKHFSLHTVISLSLGILLFAILYMGMGCLFQKQIFVPLVSRLFESRDKESAQIQETIQRYNKVFTDLYVSDGQVMRLDDLPVRTVLKHEIYRELDFLRAKELVLIYDMASLKFVSTKFMSPFSAEVTTFEEWNYVYRKGAERKQAGKVKGLGSGFRYHMIKQQGGWKIADVDPVKIASEEKDEFKY
ncbi:hypothetical protein AOG1_12780 [Geobacter sp. AOG1]|nr:hypothetical protein AOG1_12780 [Geobacter sp. AOG1]